MSINTFNRHLVYPVVIGKLRALNQTFLACLTSISALTCHCELNSVHPSLEVSAAPEERTQTTHRCQYLPAEPAAQYKEQENSQCKTKPKHKTKE